MKTLNKSFKFYIDVGDWSNDGHGKVERFLVTSNKKVEDVREAYFNAKKKLPEILCPENFCDDYEDAEVPTEVIESAKNAGYTFHDIEEGFFGPSDMLNYTLWFIEQGDTGLKLKEEDDIPTLSFYGFDKKNRHIGFIGYGLFYGC